MKVLVALLAAVPACAFVGTGGATAAARGRALHGYVPSGMSAEQYKKLKDKEAQDKKKKNFGAGGARGFESRSMNSFVKALEKGEAKHLMPVNPADVKSGKIALKDVPYMQRGGSWKNSDLTSNKKGWMTTGFGMRAYNDGKATKTKENKYDAQYNGRKPSVSIWGDGGSVDWTGNGQRGANGETVGARAKKNGISSDQQMWRDAGALSAEEARKRKGGPKINVPGAKPQGEKKFFGLF